MTAHTVGGRRLGLVELVVYMAAMAPDRRMAAVKRETRGTIVVKHQCVFHRRPRVGEVAVYTVESTRQRAVRILRVNPLRRQYAG